MGISVGDLCEDQENCVKVDNNKTDAHINDLPEDILSFILSFLTMRENVKTRTLSRRWRYLSASTSDLNFDLFTIFGINYDTYYMSKNSGNLWEGRFRFIKSVDQFMQVCRSPKIYSFKVSYCLGNESANHIDRWISLAVSLHTEKINLNFSSIPKGGELYSFPCNLLPRGKASVLKHLRLKLCKLSPPHLTTCLSSLKTLKLYMVSLDRTASINILSGCIKLEVLGLDNCTLPETFSISGKFLHLRMLKFKNCEGAKTIEMTSIHLSTFEYTGRVITFSFIGVPCIEKVHFMLQYALQKGIDYMFNGLAKDLPQLQVLSLALFTSQVPPLPANMTKFSYLKELELSVIATSRYDILSVVLILNASPCVQKFHLALHAEGVLGTIVERREYSKQFYYELKEVEVSGFRDRWNALELAVHLLESSVGLERMILNSTIKRTCGVGRWFIYEGRKMDTLEMKRIHELLSKELVNSKVALIVM